MTQFTKGAQNITNYKTLQTYILAILLFEAIKFLIFVEMQHKHIFHRPNF